MQITDLNTGVEVLIEAIKTDYRDWMLRDDEYTTVQQNMVDAFESGIGYSEGKKYIKITKENNGCVWGFVVKEDGPKFKKGDILKAAGWNAPATNVARGNVFDSFSINWTGPKYLKG
jgi:hypothetical protein